MFVQRRGMGWDSGPLSNWDPYIGNMDTVTPTQFGFIHREVSLFNQFFALCSMDSICSNTNACCYWNGHCRCFTPVPFIRSIVDDLEQTTGLGTRFEDGCAGQNQRKLFTAITTDKVSWLQCFVQALCHLSQNRIACLMAPGIVNRLE